MTLAAGRVLACGRPLVIAHRGYSRFSPENTLPAFDFAMAAGADLVEMDVRQSADGVPVVIHDAELDRTTDATHRWGRRRIPVQSKTAAEIASLDAGSWFHPRFAGVRVPLLQEALDVVGHRSVALLERKAGDDASCAHFLRAGKHVNRVIVQSFDWAFLRALHHRLPEQVLAALGPPTRFADGKRPRNLRRGLNARWLDRLAATGASVVVWGRSLSRGAVRLAHERGLRVWVYTIDSPRLAGHLIDLGVDGVITNNPSAMWRVIALKT